MYFLFTFVRMNLDLKAHMELYKKKQSDENESFVFIDFLRIDNQYFTIKTQIHTH